MRQCFLTTVDNPFDPSEQFDSWFAYDIEKGHNCCGRLMRIAKISDSMSEDESLIETERAIDRIIELDITNTYKKVVKELNDIEE